MAAQFSPVTPDVVRWAIDEDGRSVPELAEALEVDADTIDGWTRGDAAPTRGQVSRLATVLHRPRGFSCCLGLPHRQRCPQISGILPVMIGRLALALVKR